MLKDADAIGGADLLFVNQCHFYSNGDWHCVVKPALHTSASLSHLLAHAWFEREIGFNDGNYFVKNADRMPSALQTVNPEVIQFDVCLTRPQ